MHWGVVIALITTVVMWWLLYKTTVGFEIRTVGQNAKAAKYAGIRVGWTIIFTMMLAGGLAGLAGGIETLGLNHKFAPEFGGGVGFDGITVALLGQTNPFGVAGAAFLFGAMDAGAATMQFQSGVAADIILVIQAAQCWLGQDVRQGGRHVKLEYASIGHHRRRPGSGPHRHGDSGQCHAPG